MSSTGELQGTGGEFERRKHMFNLFICRCSFCNCIFSGSHDLHLHKKDANHWSDEGSEEETDSEEEEGQDSEEEGDRMV